MKVSFLGAGLLVALTGCVNVPGLGNSRYLHITNGDKTLIYSQIAFTKRESCLARKHATDQAVAQGRAWLNGGSYLCSDFDMGAKVRAHDPVFNKTLFELQTRDWRAGTSIPGDTLQALVRQLQADGVRHLGWYPDDFIGDQPRLPDVRGSLSARNFPYEER